MTRHFLISASIAALFLGACGSNTGDWKRQNNGTVEWETGGNPDWDKPSSGGSYGADGGYAAAADAAMAPTEGDPSDPVEPGVTEPDPVGGNGQVPSGVLTAGSLDDHLNPEVFDAFLTHAATFAQQGPAIEQRVQIFVEDDNGAPVNDAVVEVRAAGELLLEARTGSDGRTLFLPAHDGAPNGASFEVTVNGAGGSAMDIFTVADQSWTLVLKGANASLPSKLDLAFIVDTTGSMGDELEFIKAETANIAAKVAAQYPGVDIRFGLIVYRDDGDQYITRGYGFGDLKSFQAFVAKQSAGGGGDYPEAMHVALTEALGQLPWRTGNVARMAFLLADAPPHDEHLAATFAAIDGLRRAAVRLYPVASSGVADLAEYVLRAGAFVTLGRYIFLTDDSGIGNPHQEPHTPVEESVQPCYTVEKLEQVMIRMIASELGGTLLSPDPSNVLRTVGNPVDGVCQPNPPPAQ